MRRVMRAGWKMDGTGRKGRKGRNGVRARRGDM